MPRRQSAVICLELAPGAERAGVPRLTLVSRCGTISNHGVAGTAAM